MAAVLSVLAAVGIGASVTCVSVGGVAVPPIPPMAVAVVLVLVPSPGAVDDGSMVEVALGALDVLDACEVALGTLNDVWPGFVLWSLSTTQLAFDIVQLMTCIVEQSLPWGQHNTVVPPANKLHEDPVAQQKFPGSPACGHLLKFAAHVLSLSSTQFDPRWAADAIASIEANCRVRIRP
ncbi:hypothetical protein NUW58_g10610 [Xylaria curta]|uniref:Uncharacterized protein n=1 Tax=Xylaria curta TaxID=42375 RepID=A0ACC1MI17_9PEZI|nr:hypothetical protein NUW58_g10610 [Xylaria curta]